VPLAAIEAWDRRSSSWLVLWRSVSFVLRDDDDAGLLLSSLRSVLLPLLLLLLLVSDAVLPPLLAGVGRCVNFGGVYTVDAGRVLLRPLLLLFKNSAGDDLLFCSSCRRCCSCCCFCCLRSSSSLARSSGDHCRVCLDGSPRK